ncbi:hypothetical protein C8Q75DRAFT_808964 [Abortiporus biennis]|nr:hypothetical protein C8Q75DRAFT_808964 [Abortiporus biennis]
MSPDWTSLTPDAITEQTESTLIVVHLLSGLFIWDTLVMFPVDWSVVVQGRRGCRWGFYFLYAICRYLGLTSIICTLAFVDMQSRPYNRDLGVFLQVVSIIALGFAYSLLSIRLLALWRNEVVGWILTVTQVGNWVVLFIGLAHVPSEWLHKSSHIGVSSSLLALSVIQFVLAQGGLLFTSNRMPPTPQSRSAHNRQHNGVLCRAVHATRVWYDQSLHYYMLVMLVQIPDAAVNYMSIDPSGLLRFSVGYVSYTLTILCACKVYLHMLLYASECPTQDTCVVFKQSLQHLFGISHSSSTREDAPNPDIELSTPSNKQMGSDPSSRSCTRTSHTNSLDKGSRVDSSAVEIKLDSFAEGAMISSKKDYDDLPPEGLTCSDSASVHASAGPSVYE